MMLIFFSMAITFYWSPCTRSGKWAVKHLCDRGNYFTSFYDFSIGFRQYGIFCF